jgi:GrpB-like predicted nucleotidyltransferase (UPF0157 family)
MHLVQVEMVLARKEEVHPYDPAWPGIIEQEAHGRHTLMAQYLLSLHQMGSTAAPGLAAKPTTDILAEVRDHAWQDAQIPARESLGYQSEGANGVPGRRYIQRLDGEAPLCDLHVYEAGQPDVQRRRNFRDVLRAHPEEALAYAAMKRALVEEYTYELKR